MERKISNLVQGEKLNGKKWWLIKEVRKEKKDRKKDDKNVEMHPKIFKIISINASKLSQLKDRDCGLD